MGKTCKERGELMSQLAAYRKRDPPYDLLFELNSSPMLWWYCVGDALPMNQDHIAQLATKLFSITPHAAACERVWSTLGWYYGKRRTRLGLGKIERMQKLAAFYLANAKKELPYYGAGKSNEELQSILNDANLYEDEDYEEESNELNDINILEGDNNNTSEDSIHLDNILNLDASEILRELGEFIEDSEMELERREINNNNNNETNQENNVEDDWDPHLAVDTYL